MLILIVCVLFRVSMVILISIVSGMIKGVIGEFQVIVVNGG